MHAPGFYKINSKSLSLRELVHFGPDSRFRRLLLLPFTLFVARFRPINGGVWMPVLSKQTECKFSDFSERCRQVIASRQQAFQQMGFVESGFARIPRELSLFPYVQETAEIIYLHTNRSHIGALSYQRQCLPSPVNKVIEHINVTFTVVFERGSFSVTNVRKRLISNPKNRVVRINSDDTAEIHERFVTAVAEQTEVPLTFDEDTRRQWSDAMQIERLENGLRQGILVKMTDKEIQDARARIPPPIPVK